MNTISRITSAEAKELLDNPSCQIIDVRDLMSFNQYHLTGAAHIDNGSLGGFLASADKSAPTLVFCYHGNSSQQATGFLMQEGFTSAHSVDGGMEVWRQLYPDTLQSV